MISTTNDTFEGFGDETTTDIDPEDDPEAAAEVDNLSSAETVANQPVLIARPAEDTIKSEPSWVPEDGRVDVTVYNFSSAEAVMITNQPVPIARPAGDTTMSEPSWVPAPKEPEDASEHCEGCEDFDVNDLKCDGDCSWSEAICKVVEGNDCNCCCPKCCKVGSFSTRAVNCLVGTRAAVFIDALPVG
jgi:hypothetical protein